MRPAAWGSQGEDGLVHCGLCPRGCRLQEGERGFCRVRWGEGGTLWTEAGDGSSALAVDPVEKKPLYHFHPGARVLSFGTLGCNLDCAFCQNWSISRGRGPLHPARPQDFVRMAQAQDCQGVAFTYNEPIVSYEFCLEVAAACREAGLATVAVTAGYISERARAPFFALMDAANVDLKGFSDIFYREHCQGRLGPVLDTLAFLAASATWLEVTTLLIPGLNDAPEELEAQCGWMRDRLGPQVPLHLSAFHPDHRMQDRPATPLGTLRRAREIAEGEGLHHVYLGNVRDEDGSTTWCPTCGLALIQREGHEVVRLDLEHGRCPDCGYRMPGRFDR